MSNDELVTGAEIPRRLGVSRERVRQWASNGKFVFPVSLGRFGSAKLWRWDEVERWVETYRGTPGRPALGAVNVNELQ